MQNELKENISTVDKEQNSKSFKIMKRCLGDKRGRTAQKSLAERERIKRIKARLELKKKLWIVRYKN